MRKKSHISLANHMLNEFRDDAFIAHTYMFQFGSLLPGFGAVIYYKKASDGYDF